MAASAWIEWTGWAAANAVTLVLASSILVMKVWLSRRA